MRASCRPRGRARGAELTATREGGRADRTASCSTRAVAGSRGRPAPARRWAIAGGAVITPTVVKVPPAVRAGDQVTMVIRAGAMEVRGAGRAVSSGAVGDVIRVMRAEPSRAAARRAIVERCCGGDPEMNRRVALFAAARAAAVHGRRPTPEQQPDNYDEVFRALSDDSADRSSAPPATPWMANLLAIGLRARNVNDLSRSTSSSDISRVGQGRLGSRTRAATSMRRPGTSSASSRSSPTRFDPTALAKPRRPPISKAAAPRLAPANCRRS